MARQKTALNGTSGLLRLASIPGTLPLFNIPEQLGIAESFKGKVKKSGV